MYVTRVQLVGVLDLEHPCELHHKSPVLCHPAQAHPVADEVHDELWLLRALQVLRDERDQLLDDLLDRLRFHEFGRCAVIQYDAAAVFRFETEVVESGRHRLLLLWQCASRC